MVQAYFLLIQLQPTCQSRFDEGLGIALLVGLPLLFISAVSIGVYAVTFDVVRTSVVLVECNVVRICIPSARR